MKALAKDRDERYATAKDFAQAVKDGPASSGRPTRAPRPVQPT